MPQIENKTIRIPSIEVMTKRPDEMSYQEYREKRKDLDRKLKERLKGVLFHLSHEMIQDPFIKGKHFSKKYPPFVGSSPLCKIV
ncbi:MAG: hypothetical protein RRY36_05275 [Bacteroidaceae bacterium]